MKLIKLIGISVILKETYGCFKKESSKVKEEKGNWIYFSTQNFDQSESWKSVNDQSEFRFFSLNLGQFYTQFDIVSWSG